MLSFLLGFFWSLNAQAAVERDHYTPVEIGHNLTITSYVFQKGQCTIGFQLSACGVTDEWSVGTSSWLWYYYRMASLAAKGLIHEEEDGDRWAMQAAYFRSLKKREGQAYRYEMEAIWLNGIRSLNMAPHYKIHLNLHTNYYLNEKMPFSLRRPYHAKTPFQINVSSLHEMQLVNGWYIFLELGLLDVARSPLHLHSGGSIGKAGRGWSFHVGYTTTGSTTALFSPTARFDYQEYLRHRPGEGFDSDLSWADLETDYSIHPEFSFQVYF